MADAPRLDSWKAIARYLGRDRSTVMRWEREAGLPVRRIPGGNGRSVFAYPSEIDQWLASRGEPPATAAEPPDTRRGPQPRGLLLATALTVVVLAVLVSLAWRRPAILASAALDGRSMVGRDTAGRELWRTDALALAMDVVAPVIRVGDIDGDGRVDVLAALQFLNRDGSGFGEIARLDARGRRLWSRRLDDQFTFGDATYGPGWYPDDVISFQVNGAPRIAAAFHHHTWWPDIVATMDANGQVLGRFVHAGWITELNASADGRWLLAAGVSNAYGGAALSVIDATAGSGTGPMEGGALAACRDCPEGRPAHYIVVPWSDLAQPSKPPPVTVRVTGSGTIELHAVQRPAPYAVAPELIVTLTDDLAIVQRSASDGFAEMHARLESTGDIAHPFARCPWATPAVRAWTPAASWR